MSDQENSGENRCCRWCAGLEPRDSVGDGREEQEMVSERSRCRRPAGPADEKYLQIPTYLRWGRRLS